MRVRLVFVGLIAACAAAIPAAAQQMAPTRQPPQDQAQLSQRHAPLPKQRSRSERLDALYEALKVSPDVRTAQAVEARIEAMQLQSGSDTADLLMTRARTALEAKDYALSIRVLDTIIGLAPGYTEAYAQRATVLYLRKDFYRSLADLRVVIAREPRHFGALVGLGVILQDIGQDKLALDAFRRAVSINPHIKGAGELIKRLQSKVEGREI